MVGFRYFYMQWEWILMITHSGLLKSFLDQENLQSLTQLWNLTLKISKKYSPKSRNGLLLIVGEKRSGVHCPSLSVSNLQYLTFV